MQIRPVDVHDDAQCARAHEVVNAASSFERPHWALSSLPEHVAEWRHEDPAERHELWGAWRGEEMAGVALMWLPVTDNTAMTWVDVNVEPRRRRQGIGTALMDHLVARAREQARTTILAGAAYPLERLEDHPYRRFLEKNGFTLGNLEVARRLRLPLDEGFLAGLADEARVRYAGRYRLETHLDGVPKELQGSLCAVMNQLGVDAPTGEIDFEEESLTPERYRDYLDLERRQGRIRLTTVGVHRDSGEVVAYTDLILPSGSETHAWQWGTMVHREHRGHRLGLAVKVENLRRLQSEHPGRVDVQTGNAASNQWMLAINERLGFEVLELYPEFQRKLS